LADGDSMEGFWEFSLRTYAADGVADACLTLQNGHGADVNMLLYCCWAAGRIGRFDDTLFVRATGFSTSWAEHLVRPLRSSRTWLKAAGCADESVPTERCMALREKIKAVELSCEKMQQQALESMIATGQPRGGSSDQLLEDIVANLLRYWGYAGIDASDDVSRRLAVLIHAAYPELDEDRIALALA
jgi:uncharacterized protein (TIGR02444 family)